MLAAFGYRDFRIQWIGACSSAIGTWMQIIAQNWLVLSLTNSSFFLGLDAFLQQLPIIMFTLIGGVFADRYDRRKTLLASQYIQMFTSGTLAVLMYMQVVQVWHIMSLSFITGVAQSFGGPAYQSLLPSLVAEKDLPNAIALNSIQFNLAQVLGPLLFAATLATFLKWGYNEPQAMNAAFFLNALSFLIVIGTLMSLHVKHVPPTHTRRMREELQGGLHYVRNHGSLVALIVLAAATTFLGFAVLTFLPVFTQRVFRGGAGTYSRLMAFSGTGSIAGALGVAWKIQADGCDGADDAGHLRSADSGVLHVAHDLAERSSAPLHRRVTDDGVFDSHLACTAHRPQRDSRPRDEHLHGGVPRRHAARQPCRRLLRDDHRGAEGHRHQRLPPGPRRPLSPIRSQPRNTRVRLTDFPLLTPGVVLPPTVFNDQVIKPAQLCIRPAAAKIRFISSARRRRRSRRL